MSSPEPTQASLDFILLLIVGIALAVGILSQLVGVAVRAWDLGWAWWDAYCQTFRLERGLITSSDEGDAGDDERVGTSTVRDDQKLVLADTDAVPVGSHASTGSRLVPSLSEPFSTTISRRMRDTELLTLLAVQRDESGWKFSANKLYALIGGNREVVMTQIKALRNLPPEPMFVPLDSERRPVEA